MHTWMKTRISRTILRTCSPIKTVACPTPWMMLNYIKKSLTIVWRITSQVQWLKEVLKCSQRSAEIIISSTIAWQRISPIRVTVISHRFRSTEIIARVRRHSVCFLTSTRTIILMACYQTWKEYSQVTYTIKRSSRSRTRFWDRGHSLFLIL